MALPSSLGSQKQIWWERYGSVVRNVESEHPEPDWSQSAVDLLIMS